MVCIISNMGLRIVSNKLLLDAAIPTGIPIIIQKITAVNIIAKVVMVSFQRSTRSIEIRASAEKIANFKIPAHYRFQKDKLPRIASGKIAKIDMRKEAVELLKSNGNIK